MLQQGRAAAAAAAAVLAVMAAAQPRWLGLRAICVMVTAQQRPTPPLSPPPLHGEAVQLAPIPHPVESPGVLSQAVWELLERE